MTALRGVQSISVDDRRAGKGKINATLGDCMVGRTPARLFGSAPFNGWPGLEAVCRDMGTCIEDQSVIDD